jgi:glycosyltransferase involved in cell wall biosynthesis
VPREYGSDPYFQADVPIREFDAPALVSQLDNPDVLVVTDPQLLAVVAAHRKRSGTFLLLQHDTEYIFEIDGKVSPLQAHVDYLRTTCKIIVVSDWIQDALQVRLGLPSYVVRNGVDKELFHPDPEPLIHSENPTVLISYDPQPWKGFDDAISALQDVKSRLPEVRIAIISQGFPIAPEAGMSISFAFPVIYFNRPDQRDMAKVFSSATVFVSASWQEGFGLPGLEAMACGVPVVTTDSGGVSEYAVPNKTALVVPPRNIPELTEAILKVLHDEELRTKLSRNGLQKAKQFDWGQSMKKIEELFRQNV